MPSMASFHPAAREWFAAAFPGGPTRAQERGFAAIAAGESTLILAPTGSGKTLAAFLSALSRLAFFEPPPRPERCRVVYVSPLKALAVDVEKNLRVPIAGLAQAAARRGDAFHEPLVAIRSGDTPQDERSRMLRRPPDILVTTPESLCLMLTSRARETLRFVELVIVDEIHAMAGTKRGAHLALSLERLEALAPRRLQRVGLSATQRPLEEVARFLGGGDGTAWTPRPVRIVDAGIRRAFDIRVCVPDEDMKTLGSFAPAEVRAEAKEGSSASGPEARPGSDLAPVRRSLWTSLQPRVLELVRSHRSTLVFVNSRRLAERMAAALNALAGEPIARAHHGSVARDERLEMEQALKQGRLPALVATSTLELGIDMGAIDLVVQIETPPSVASGMQRIGRAGHQVEAVSRGIVFPKHRADLLAAAALARGMREGDVEPTVIPTSPLDVLAQQLVAMATTAVWTVDEMHQLVRRAAPYAHLTRGQLEGVLDMLSGRYPADELAALRPRLVWDRRRGTVRAREGAGRIVVANVGTIPDRGLYGVFLVEGAAPGPDGRPRSGRRVGELDEEMVFESREGEVFVLGASSWRIVEIARDRVLVAPAPGVPGKMPFWKADRGYRPFEQGARIGRLSRDLVALGREAATERLGEHHGLDSVAARNLLDYLDEQREATGVVPDDRTLVVERLRDEMGDWRVCLLSPFGGRVHTPWALAVGAALAARGGARAEPLPGDDGIVWRFPDAERPPDTTLLIPEPDEVEALALTALGGSALLAARFREAAARALLLPRRRPGQRSPLWMQRKRSADLLAVASRYADFPILLEAYRECLKEVFDLPALVGLLARIRRREIRVVTVERTAASPFAAALLFGYVGNYLYDGDAPAAERRAQALSIDTAQLRELMGEADLREVLDAEALADLEAELQGLGGVHAARSADGLHDLLRRIGDLTEQELAGRVAVPAELAASWLRQLEDEGRVHELEIAAERRLVAAEDVGRFRDALGTSVPAGVDPAHLAPVPGALGEILSRYARTHGPFRPAAPAARFGLDDETVGRELVALVAAGRLEEGAFCPGGSGREYCSPEVLRTLRRRCLARLRREVEPTEPAALSRLLLDWQSVTAPLDGGSEALLDIVEQLQGAAVPASVLETDVLPARLVAYRSSDLDALVAAGEIVLVGCGSLGERDGRISLLLADDVALLRPDLQRQDWPPLHATLLSELDRRGASFFADLAAATGEPFPTRVLDALWELFWAAEVTIDTPASLRAFLKAHASRARRPGRLSPFRSRRETPPSALGRWSRLAHSSEPNATQRATARADQLLLRHGVLTREGLEGFPGGLSGLYPVLRAMEEAGRIRRGYFVAGLGGLQFAHPGALERLRVLRQGADEPAPAQVLAATDPAVAFGVALPWPEVRGWQPMRVAGAHVALVEGRLAAFLTRDEAEVHSILPEEEPDRSAVARALATGLLDWLEARGAAVLGWSPDGPRLADDPLAPYLLDAGLLPSGPGFRLPPTAA